MATAILTEQDIRVFLMDKPELNSLTDGVRFSPLDIEKAVENAVDYFNITNPPTNENYTVETFPYRYLLTIGAAGHLLRSAAIHQASNQFSYSADGVSVDDTNKAGIFSQLGTQFWSEFMQMTKDIKLNNNLAQCYGVKHSEYQYRAS